jgi:hypothetical protein
MVHLQIIILDSYFIIVLIKIALMILASVNQGTLRISFPVPVHRFLDPETMYLWMLQHGIEEVRSATLGDPEKEEIR